MVIQEENKASILSQLHPQTKKCALVKHHVHESDEDQSQSEIVFTLCNNDSLDCNQLNMKDKSGRKRSKKFLSSSESKESVETNIVNPEDLEELRSVYKKCKAVVKKIETKYGHLLNLDESEVPRASEPDNNEETSKCECTANKKIIFDDEGKEITAETDLDNHICPKKLKVRRSHVELSQDEPHNNLKVEYDTLDSTLPDDIQSLTNILHDPEIETTYRNKVIRKIKIMKQEFMDEIRFNKQSLIEKLRTEPEEVFDFKGSNLKSLPGYKC